MKYIGHLRRHRINFPLKNIHKNILNYTKYNLKVSLITIDIKKVPSSETAKPMGGVLK